MNASTNVTLNVSVKPAGQMEFTLHLAPAAVEHVEEREPKTRLLPLGTSCIDACHAIAVPS